MDIHEAHKKSVFGKCYLLAKPVTVVISYKEQDQQRKNVNTTASLRIILFQLRRDLYWQLTTQGLRIPPPTPKPIMPEIRNQHLGKLVIRDRRLDFCPVALCAMCRPRSPPNPPGHRRIGGEFSSCWWMKRKERKLWT